MRKKIALTLLVVAFALLGAVCVKRAGETILGPGESITIACATCELCPDTPTLISPTDTPVPPTATATSTATLLPTHTPTNTPTVVPPTNTPGPSTGDLAGILCSGEIGFGPVKGLGGEMTSFPSQRTAGEFLALLDSAQAKGLRLIARGPGSTSFTDGMKLNFDRLRAITENLYGGTGVAQHPAYAGWYIIDEPCASWKYDITPAEMQKFYDTIKSVDPDIVVIVNFSWLECARNLNAANATDIAALTYTVARPPGHWASQAGIARDLKTANPDLKVVPWVAVYECPAGNAGCPARGVPMPSADWVREKGMEVLQYDVFDGVMFYPWQPDGPYFGKTIQDVADDPAYISAFSDVFATAKQ